MIKRRVIITVIILLAATIAAVIFVLSPKLGTQDKAIMFIVCQIIVLICGWLLAMYSRK